jgi:hypothetical protein
MDYYGSKVIIDKNVKCIDDDFTKEWNENVHIQAWITALKLVYGTEDGDNKGELF